MTPVKTVAGLPFSFLPSASLPIQGYYDLGPQDCPMAYSLKTFIMQRIFSPSLLGVHMPTHIYTHIEKGNLVFDFHLIRCFALTNEM